MADRWIVSRHPYHQHRSLASAEAEANRVNRLTGKPFTIYRVKTALEASRSYELINKLAAENETLRAALKPFAAAALRLDYNPDATEDAIMWRTWKIADVYAARAALGLPVPQVRETGTGGEDRTPTDGGPQPPALPLSHAGAITDQQEASP